MHGTKPKSLFTTFAKKEKQDDGTIKVWGYASSEAVDADGDVIKASAMAGALPEYMKFGNIREMHQPLAAGVAIEAEVLTDGRTWLGAHIVDPIAVKKIETEVYKGFSIGGNATEYEPGTNNVITGLQLNEISLVDRPANPDAVFEIWKAQGMKPTAPEPTPAEQVDKLAAVLNSGEITIGEVLKAVHAAVELKKAKNGGTGQSPADEDQQAQNNTDATKAAGKDDEKDGKKPEEDEDDEMEKATKASDSDKPYGDVEYADSGKQEDGKKRYPIDTAEHIRAAWNYINKPKNADKYSAADLKAIKGKIVAAWKDKIDADGPPSASKDKAAGSDDQQAGGSADTATTPTGAVVDANKDKAAAGGEVQKALTATNNNGVEAEYPKVGGIITLKEGDFTVQATVVQLENGMYTVNTETMEVTVNQSKLVHTEGRNEGAPDWHVTMDQIDGRALKAAKSGTLEKAAGKPLKKSLYSISDLACTLSSLNWQLQSVQWEEAGEKDDGSATLAAFKKWMDDGMALLATMIGEEVEEYNEANNIELAMDSGFVQKCLMPALVQKGQIGAPLQKAMISDDVITSHPEFNNLLEKAVKGHTSELQKALGEVTDRLKKLEAQPAPAKGVTKAIAKGTDVVDPEQVEAAVSPVTYQGAVDPVATALKKSLSNPGVMQFGGAVHKNQ